MTNVVCLKDCLHYDDYCESYNGQRISLDKLATREMGAGIACIVYVNGKLVPDDWGRVIEPSDQVIFAAIAAGGEGSNGGKDAFRMIAQIALLASVVIFSGGIGALGGALSAATGGFLSSATAAQLITSSILFVGNLAINALFPQSGGSQDDSQQFKTLSPQNNLARIGQPISEVFGTMRVFPDMVSTPLTRYRDNKPQLFENFHVTAGVADVTDFRIGDVNVSDYSDVVATTTSENIQAAFSVVNAQGLELIMPRDDGLPDQVLWGANEGFTPWLNLCPPKETLGNLGFLMDLSLSFGQGIGGDGTPEFAVVSSGGGDPDLYDYHEGVQLYWRQVDDLGQANGTSGDFAVKVPVKPAALGDNEAYNTTIGFTGNTGIPPFPPGTMSLPSDFKNKRIQVRLKRTVEKSSDSQQAASVSMISLIGYGDSVTNVDGVLVRLAAGQMKRLPLNGGQMLNAIVKRHIHTFTKNGANFEYDALQYADTPSQVIFHMLYEHFGSFAEVFRLVDLDALWALHGMNIANDEKFNARINTQRKFWDWLEQVGFCMRTKPIRRGGKITFIRDMATELPNFGVPPLGLDEARYKFNGFHIVRDGLNAFYEMVSSDDIYDGVKLDFIDERIWQFNDYLLAFDGGNAPDNPMIIDAKGVTDIENIKAIAAHLVAAMKYRKINVTFKTELDGLLPHVGNVVYLQHGLIDKGMTAQIYSQYGLKLSFETPLDTAYSHAVIRLGEARASQKIAIVIGADLTSVTLAELPQVDGADVSVKAFLDEPDAADTISFYNQLDDEPCMVKITKIKYGGKGATISGFVDDARVYAA